jgi:hypothetical protein
MEDAHVTPAYSTPLFEAIQAKCQREQWFGADLDDSRWYMVDPDIDPFEEPEKSILPVADHPRRFSFAFPPASEKQVQATEARLGFPLPPFLKTLYMHIANGGFGPGAGLRGIEGGYDGGQRDGTILDRYPTEAKPDRFFDLPADRRTWLIVPQERWPRRVICLANMGCAQEVCVDSATSRMYLLGVTAESQHALEPLPWTLEEWLWRWVRNEKLLEEYAPGAA